MATYETLDYLPDLSATEMSAAETITLEPASSNSSGWDYSKIVGGNESYALLHDTYRFTAKAGATYDIISTSYFDPFLLRIYDQFGNTIVANDEDDDYPDFFLGDGYYSNDCIFNWTAPYTGDYYVAANWHQGNYYKFYALSIYEDVDTATVRPNTPPTGSIIISGTTTKGQTLTASNTLSDADGLGSISYQWKANGSIINGATGPSLTLTQAQVGQSISVTASYTDGQGTLESVTSAATAAIANVNDAPNGNVTISGTTTQGQTLIASNTLTDADGLGSINYQWKANGTTISGATGSSLPLTQAQVGQFISVTATYTDGQGTRESVTSAATAAIANVNDAPNGSVNISGSATQGRTLTASNTLTDADGLGSISYQWKANGSAISGATGPSLTLTQAQVGQSITVTASYTDGQGTRESVTSAATAAIANVNDAPNGSVTISGTAAQGETLRASNTLTDADGLGSISYQWKANGSAISGATNASYTLTQAEVGKTMTVTASYTDDGGTVEAVTSSAITVAIGSLDDILNTLGITRQQAGDWVVQHLTSAQDIYNVVSNSGITSNMLAEVVQPFLPDIVVTGVVVNDWLQANGQPALI